jgi:NADH-quinone oxidoreductase subunit E
LVLGTEVAVYRARTFEPCRSLNGGKMEEGNVLISTNDEPLGEYLYHQINGLGWTVSRTGMFSELLRKIKEEKADILILDSSLEGIASFDLLPLIKKSNPGLPVIALNDDSSLEMSKRVRLQGIFFLAMKPIDPAEIRTAVGDAIRMLNQKQQQRRNQNMAQVIAFPAGEEDKKLAQVQEILKEHEGQRGHLLIVLQKVQAIYGYVPQNTFEMVADALGAARSEIFGVLTFYNRFHLSPQGKHTVRVCRGTACHFKGAPSIIESIRKQLRLPHGKETTDDFLFSMEEVACLGACGISPVMAIDEETYGNLTPGMAVEIVAKYEAEEKAPAAAPEVAAEEKKAA